MDIYMLDPHRPVSTEADEPAVETQNMSRSAPGHIGVGYLVDIIGWDLSARHRFERGMYWRSRAEMRCCISTVVHGGGDSVGSLSCVTVWWVFSLPGRAVNNNAVFQNSGRANDRHPTAQAAQCQTTP